MADDGPGTFAVVAGTPPPGRTLAADGTLSGTPTTAGTFTFTVSATVATGDFGSETVTITIEAATTPTIDPPVPPIVPPVLPIDPPARPTQFAAGSDIGLGQVKLYNADQSVRFTTEPFPGFTGVRVASADFNGDGVADLVVGTGPRVSPPELFGLDAFSGFTEGVFVGRSELSDSWTELKPNCGSSVQESDLDEQAVLGCVHFRPLILFRVSTRVIRPTGCP